MQVLSIYMLVIQMDYLNLNWEIGKDIDGKHSSPIFLDLKQANKNHQCHISRNLEMRPHFPRVEPDPDPIGSGSINFLYDEL
jgi:hypothetical protein